jgi:hypothetical protein
MPEPNPNDNVLDAVVEVDVPFDSGDDEMANGTDIDESAYQELVEEDIRTNSVISQEHQGNAESESSLVNHSGGKKFAKEDAIEAASVEMILQLNS